MTMSDRAREKRLDYEKRAIASDLEPVVEDAQDLARDLGLDPYPVKYWIIDNDEMNELIAYNGFQERYPHWRWGMQYDKQRKQSQFGGGKAFEIVNNDNPAHAFLQRSNSMADQKAVITHVEAHSDFFKNNQWFSNNPDAAAMLARHSEKIETILDDPDVSREDVEKWIDHCLCLEDTINQFESLQHLLTHPSDGDEDEGDAPAIQERVDDLGISEDVAEDIFDDEWLEEQRAKAQDDVDDNDMSEDLLSFFLLNGKQYDEENERAVEYEEWQVEVLEIMLKEAHYFAPQKMTKIMNEGWAAYWESIMMTDELFAGDDEFIEYADHMSMVLESPGFNPYKLGLELWQYVENQTNRREVIDKLLRVEGITARNFHDELNFEQVQTLLDKRDSDNFAERHYSLTRPQNWGFLRQITREQLEDIWRYIIDSDQYASVADALATVDYETGWRRMRDVRASHNDVTFLDEFLTEEFITDEEYFTYEYNANSERMEVASTDPDDVKRKLLLQFTNFGKPTIVHADSNFKNTGELLLHHEYNGIMLDMAQAEQTLKRVFELWGRPVNLKTIVKGSDGSEEGRLLNYDGDDLTVEKLRWSDVEPIAAEDVDYDTKPDDWV